MMVPATAALRMVVRGNENPCTTTTTVIKAKKIATTIFQENENELIVLGQIKRDLQLKVKPRVHKSMVVCLATMVLPGRIQRKSEEREASSRFRYKRGGAMTHVARVRTFVPTVELDIRKRFEGMARTPISHFPPLLARRPYACDIPAACFRPTKTRFYFSNKRNNNNGSIKYPVESGFHCSTPGAVRNTGRWLF